MPNQQEVDELLRQKIALEKEIADLFEPAQKLVPAIREIITGVGRERKACNREILKFSYANDTNDTNSYPCYTNLEDILSKFANGINMKTKLYHISYGYHYETRENEDLDSRNYGEFEEVCISNYRDISYAELVDSLKTGYYEGIQSIAVKVAGDVNSGKIKVDGEHGATIRAFAVLTDSRLGSHGFLSVIDKSAEWAKIDQKLQELAKLLEKIPKELRGATVCSDILAGHAEAFLKEHGLTPTIERK